MDLLEVVDGWLAFGVAILFWLGVIYAIIIATQTSETRLLGSKVLTRVFVVIVVLFLLNFAHKPMGLPILFDRLIWEYSIIVLVFATIYLVSDQLEKGQEQKFLASRPDLQRCSKCGKVSQRIYVICPHCQKK